MINSNIVDVDYFMPHLRNSHVMARSQVKTHFLVNLVILSFISKDNLLSFTKKRVSGMQ